MRTDVSARDAHTEARTICGEVRPRLNYRLCCHLPVHHGGEHCWTPEIGTTDRDRVRCPRCDTALQVTNPPATIERLADGTGAQHIVIRDRDRRILHECST